jgi:signal transduction histidine kinase
MDADEKINILIVDDLPEKLLVLESILEELGENIIKAHSGAEALRLVLEHDFAVILLDVYMPGMNGFETAGLIRQRRKSAHTPIIFITAFADEMHTAQGYSMGAVDYILSPVVPEILRTKVKVFVDLYRMTQQVKRHADERVALAQEQAARAAAEENVRRMNEFLAMLSHELRNPLAPIRNAIQLLRGRSVREADVPSLYEMIDRQVQHLTHLVDDLLDLSRITRGKIHLQMERVAVGDVVARAVETSRPLIDARKHALAVAVPPEPLYVRGDLVRLAQLLSNLLNNAAKYTEEGGHIFVGVERRDAMATFRVRDNGIGIPREMLSSIFELFKQVDRSLDRSQGGLGIGLTLVHKLVGLHGGRVEAFSGGPNQGSEFVVHLPLWHEEESLSHPAAIRLPSAPTDGTSPTTGGTKAGGTGGSPGLRRRVLIVDDNTDAAHSLALLMEMGGHETRICYDGQSALTEAQKFLPDVVLLDIGLPGLDGLEVARRLRAMNLSPRPTLVALTGYGQHDDLRRSREAGFDHHLVKPADPQTLIALLASTPQPESCPV